tara:strand:+ start:2087 stop:2467 length:381 start_codon:yes stop_codon:yes gene_type:complete
MNWHEEVKLADERETCPIGLCFPFANELAWTMVEDGVIPEGDIFVCHGTVEEPLALEPKRYEHAWIEAAGRVYDWQMNMSGRGSIENADFYDLFKPQNVVRYSPEQALKNQAKHDHQGPWTDELVS